MSLRLRLVVFIGLALSVLWAGAASWMWQDVDATLQRMLDGRLAMSARMVAGLLSQRLEPARNPDMIEPADVLVTVPGGNGMACQIRSMRGEVIAATRSAPPGLSAVAEPGYHTRTLNGTRWRTFTLRVDGLSITTADRVAGRDELRRRIALAAGTPFVIAAMGGLLTLWFGTTRGLAPLQRLRRGLARRQPDALEPLESAHLPQELRPLVETLNHLLERIREAIRRERHFTNDAAHELRTPLTAISTQLQVAAMTRGEQAEHALTLASQGVERMRATLDQLLLLARVEGRLPFEGDDPVSATEVIRRVVTDIGGKAAARVLHRGAGGQCRLAVPPALAVTALRNVVDNALRYSPDAALVTVTVEANKHSVSFHVADHGPGLASAGAEQARQRFWRASAGNGSGLGLTIVDAIVDRYEGRLGFADSPGGGLTVQLTLPRIAG